MTKENIKTIKTKSSIREWAEAILVAFVIAMLVRTFVLQPFKIPTGSMEPTLHGDPSDGDRIFVSKFDFLINKPVRGDIVVFRTVNIPGLDGTKDFVKRLVGLPGDRVEIKDGHIYINDQLLDYPEVFTEMTYYNHGYFGQENHQIIVPDDMYYVLGDNSGVSKDSRFWGFVPKDNMIGTVSIIYWPLNRFRVFHHPDIKFYN